MPQSSRTSLNTLHESIKHVRYASACRSLAEHSTNENDHGERKYPQRQLGDCSDPTYTSAALDD